MSRKPWIRTYSIFGSTEIYEPEPMWKTVTMPELRKFGPKKAEHVRPEDTCPACKKPFKEGDYSTLIALGPGDDSEAQAHAREGRPYNAIALEVHYACATGEV